MNSLPKFAVSKTLEEVECNNSSLIKENVAEEVSRLKQQPGQNILIYGSSELVNTLSSMTSSMNIGSGSIPLSWGAESVSL